MDRLINYGGSWNKPITSNSDYGRGVLASMRKGQPVNFDPAAGNYYQVVMGGAGNGQWHPQNMANPTQGQNMVNPTQGHVHAPTCPNYCGAPGNFDPNGVRYTNCLKSS